MAQGRSEEKLEFLPQVFHFKRTLTRATLICDKVLIILNRYSGPRIKSIINKIILF